MSDALEIIPFGAKALIINWPQQISEQINGEISAFNHLINTHFKDLLLETVCTYCSLTLYLKQPHNADLIDNIQSLLAIQYQQSKTHKPTIWYIPVCYDSTFGIDIDRVAKINKLSHDEVIQLHTKPLYHVYFLGFLPGFPYLGGLDDKLITPRLVSPRQQIPKGSVAIGNQQTGVYPSSSPGGWNIIGNSPVDFFDSQKPNPTFLRAGDKIKFCSINRDDYDCLKQRIEKKQFSIEELKSNGFNHD